MELARTKASRTADAENACVLCGDGMSYRLCIGLISDHGVYISWRSCFDHCSQLASIQLSSSQLVGHY
ncbi:hypothetical protein LguiA_000089 [Lonicera macranthoides]